MTFDNAQDSFREKPSMETAQRYVKIAERYWRDQMLGAATLIAAIDEVQRWMEKS